MTVIDLKIAAIHPNILLPSSLYLVFYQLQQRNFRIIALQQCRLNNLPRSSYSSEHLRLNFL